MNTYLDSSTLTDHQLISRHLDGDRDAFRQIVERHQAMVCALGLSACGDVARSEDLAQEVFIAAWKQLPELREPEKLRGWLAGITRNLINNSFRRQQRIPTARAEELSLRLPAEGDSPSEQAVSRDETSLMWQALAGIPENYREPMVLFYREQQSVTAVAGALEISEEAVRQRLVRGRAMLTERMAKLVEETLERSAPTPVFAGAVMLALHMGVTPTVAEAAVVAAGTNSGAGGAMVKTLAGAGGLAAAAGKGGAAMKALSVIGLLPVLFNASLEFLKFRAAFESQGSSAKRSEVKATYLGSNILGATIVATWFGSFVLCYGDFGKRLAIAEPRLWQACFIAQLLLPLVVLVAIGRWQRKTKRRASAEGVDLESGPVVAKGFEYRSNRRVLGLPLIHIHVGGPTPVMKRTAKAWIAVTDGIALGGFFAAGGQLAMAPVSLGSAAIGFLSMGVFSLGAGAVGFFAAGLYASGGGAFGWIAAQGGLACARNFAMGKQAFAGHANDAIATSFFHEHLFFRMGEAVIEIVAVTVWFAWMPSLLLIGWYLWRKRAVK